MTATQIDAIRRVAGIIIEAVSEADPTIGSPGGHIYAALMAHGCTIHQYEQLMSGLVRAGKLRKSGECYFVV